MEMRLQLDEKDNEFTNDHKNKSIFLQQKQCEL